MGIGTRIMFICRLDPKLYRKTPFLGVFGVFFNFFYKKINFDRKTKNTVFRTHRGEGVCKIPSMCYDWFGLGEWRHTDRQIYQ